MFPLSVLTYVKLSAGIIILLGIFYAGWHLRDVDFMAYKSEVEATAKAQEEKVKSVRAQQELVTKGIQNEYDAKLALIRQYYTNGVRQPNGGSKVSGLSPTSINADALTAYNLLAGQCAETTQQLVTLQKWLNEQIGIK